MAELELALAGSTAAAEILTASAALEELATGIYDLPGAHPDTPGSASGALVHVRATSNRMYELFIPWTIDAKLWKRVYSSGRWQDWFQVNS